jgi:hypothetical protein
VAQFFLAFSSKVVDTIIKRVHYSTVAHATTANSQKDNAMTTNRSEYVAHRELSNARKPSPRNVPHRNAFPTFAAYLAALVRA